jgi:hypothetical protein
MAAAAGICVVCAVWVWECGGWVGCFEGGFVWGSLKDGVVCLFDKVPYGYGVGCGRQAVFGYRRMGFGPRY